MATRASDDSSWGTPILLGPEINTSNGEERPSISADGRILYFCSNRPGGYGSWDIWQSTISPIIDFNGDGIVDMEDLLQLIESWGKDDPSVDMGPMPWGDGKVDAKDLEVLMRYWGQEVNDPTLVGHWPLDEADGITAYDRAGGNDGTLIGLPQWRPQGGTVGGALEFNGKTFLAAKSAVNPAKGPFSILTWIKGGAPGQTIVSQRDAANWLLADAQGALATELSKGGRTGAGLSSPTLITDGNWHRIAFTWDGTNRRLYVDGVLAAEDTQEGLADSSGQLILGAGKNMAPGTFFSGLIDDVRIYKRAVKP